MDQRNTTTGAWMRAARQATGLSDRKMAGRLGVDQRTYRKWEADEKSPPVEIVAELARLAGVPAAGLLP